MDSIPLYLPPAFSLAAAAWAIVWAGLAASGVLLAVLWRTKYRHAATWKKCAVVSLWIHVFLACVATTVRLFSSVGPGLDDGDGAGAPMRVAFAAPPAEAAEARPAERAPAPRWEEPTAPPLLTPPAIPLPEPVAPAPDVELAARAEREAAPPLEPPSLLAAAKPAATPPENPATDALPPDSVSPHATPLQADKSGSSSSAGEAAQESVSSARSGEVPAAYADRFADNRVQLVAGRGGSERTERAVRSALRWLAAAQSRDGRWEPARYGAGQERYVLGQDRGGAGARAETGISGLALLAMLGAGHTHREGPYAHTVSQGLDFLRRSQGPDGNLAGKAELFARMYCHSMAMFAASEAYAITHDPELAGVVRSAAAYSLAVQHPTDGGWRYRPGDAGDTSQLGWQLMALHSAEVAGVAIPDVTWTRIERFLRNVERGAAGGLAAYRPEGPPTRTMTAEALYCRQLLAERLGGQLDNAAIAEANASLLSDRPSTELVNLYYWYYATLALQRDQHASAAAAQAWSQWNRALVQTLLATQREDGSWPETCLWGGYGGRVYTTALGAMCLEVYYRYAPGEEAAGVAQRDQWRATPQR